MNVNIKYTIYFLLGVILFYFMFNEDVIEGQDLDDDSDDSGNNGSDSNGDENGSSCASFTSCGVGKTLNDSARCSGTACTQEECCEDVEDDDDEGPDNVTCATNFNSLETPCPPSKPSINSSNTCENESCTVDECCTEGDPKPRFDVSDDKTCASFNASGCEVIEELNASANCSGNTCTKEECCELNYTYLFAGVGVLCCCILLIIGIIVFSGKSKKKRH